jgi:hypothetical protein
LAAADRLPIRVTFDTTSVTDTAQATLLSSAQRALIMGNVLPDAQAVIQNLLSVNRVVGNLTASRQCTSVFTSNGELRGCQCLASDDLRFVSPICGWGRGCVGHAWSAVCCARAGLV